MPFRIVKHKMEGKKWAKWVEMKTFGSEAKELRKLGSSDVAFDAAFAHDRFWHRMRKTEQKTSKSA